MRRTEEGKAGLGADRAEPLFRLRGGGTPGTPSLQGHPLGTPRVPTGAAPLAALGALPDAGPGPPPPAPSPADRSGPGRAQGDGEEDTREGERARAPLTVASVAASRRQSPPPAPLQHQQQQPRGRRLPPPGSSARGGGERDAPPPPPRGRAGARRQEKTRRRLLPARSAAAPAPGPAAQCLSPAPTPGPRPEPRTAASLSAPAAAREPSASRPARPPSRPQILMRTGMEGRCEGSPQRPGLRGFSSFRLAAHFLKMFPELAGHTRELHSVLTTACQRGADFFFPPLLRQTQGEKSLGTG